jgi:hypothetical protein
MGREIRSLVRKWLHVGVTALNTCVSMVSNWPHVSVIAPSIFVFFVWDWLHVCILAPSICVSLIRNWILVSYIVPNICVSLLWNWLHVSVIAPNMLVFNTNILLWLCSTTIILCLLTHMSLKLKHSPALPSTGKDIDPYLVTFNFIMLVPCRLYSRSL